MTQKEIDLLMAEQQLTGFKQGKSDGRVVHLADSMGLTKAEWIKIKTNNPTILDGRDVDDLDEHFRI